MMDNWCCVWLAGRAVVINKHNCYKQTTFIILTPLSPVITQYSTSPNIDSLHTIMLNSWAERTQIIREKPTTLLDFSAARLFWFHVRTRPQPSVSPSSFRQRSIDGSTAPPGNWKARGAVVVTRHWEPPTGDIPSLTGYKSISQPSNSATAAAAAVTRECNVTNEWGQSRVAYLVSFQLTSLNIYHYQSPYECLYWR